MRLSYLEKQLWRQGYKLIAGVDEVGRGAWAGPMVAAAVILPKSTKIAVAPWLELINDSKKLSPRRRQEIFNQLKDKITWAVGVVSNKEIDQLGVGPANRLAVKRAVNKLPLKPNYILADYVAKLPPTINQSPIKSVIHGDAKIVVIALASIMAKIYRDRLMVKFDKYCSGYGFSQHKGYGTKQHQIALAKLGVTNIHRRSYRPVARYLV
ncbi:MAG: ribonuclease HII [Patescibacteria group bacterium]